MPGEEASNGGFLRKLIAIQQSKGLTDHEFAKTLDISRQLWQKTRKGEQRVGEKLLRGAVRKYPYLMGDIIVFLQESAPRDLAAASH